ncbi:Serine aminopeptidase S33 domain-containing protein [Plasmodiophora brassicae]
MPLPRAVVGAGAVVAAAVVAARIWGDETTEKPCRDIAPCSKRFPQYLQNQQGLWLFTREWAASRPVALVYLVHGLGDHSGRFEHVARLLNKAQVSVYAVDLQGHGQSDGTPQYAERFSDFIRDVLLFVDKVSTSLPKEIRELPKFLFGHSMGGAIATHCAMLRPQYFNGVILSSPAMKPDPKLATPAKTFAAKLMSEFLPKFSVGSLDINHICHARDVVKRGGIDKLYLKLPLKARMANEFLIEMNWLQANAGQVSFPYLVFYGDDDRLVMPEGITSWNAHTQSADKTLVSFPAMSHETLYEMGFEKVVALIVEWIGARIK